jgi:hypothetical protein
LSWRTSRRSVGATGSLVATATAATAAAAASSAGAGRGGARLEPGEGEGRELLLDTLAAADRTAHVLAPGAQIALEALLTFAADVLVEGHG